MAKNKTLELSIKIAGQMDKSLTTALTGAQNQISGFSKTLGAIGTAGLAAMSALAAGGVAAIASCTKEAAKFENYMGDVVKYVDGLADETGKISDKLASNGKTYVENYETMMDTLKDLSTQIPYTFEDLTRLAAAAGQSGKSFEDLTQTDFLKDIAMWGTAMDISADQAGDWGAKWEQAFNMNHDQIMEIADVINYLGANYATTAAEIAQSVNDSASMGQLAGVDVKATAAIAASMQAMGVSTDRVGTSIKRIYTNITKGSTATAAQEAAFERLGFTATGIAQAMQTDGTGTLLKVFSAINNLPDAEKLSTLNALFGQWAIEGGAKVTQNLGLLEEMLAAVNDPSTWTGSMERELIIKASTPEAIDTMLASAKSALKADLGEAFLPAYKAFGTSMIDFIQNIRTNMPQLEQLSGTLGELASKGVERLGQAMNNALPYIQKGLDYLVNNGDQVVKIIGGMAAAFAGMKFAPAAEGLLRGAGGLLFGSGSGGGGSGGGLWGGIKSLFTGGRKAGSARAGFLSSFRGAAGSNGLRATLGTTVSSLLSGNGLTGTTGLLSAASGTPGLLSGYVGAGSVIRNGLANSRVGQWLGGIGSAMGNFGTAVGNTRAGGAVSGLLGNIGNAAGGFLSQATLGLRTRAAGLGAAGIIQGSVIQQGLSGLLGKASGLVGGIASSGAGKAVGAGAGLLGSIWGPIAGGFGSLLAGALPVVGVISAIIAVVSILGDNLEGIRTIIGNVFGEQGLAVFDKFTSTLAGVGNFISGLFVDGGVAKALSGFREMLFGDGGIFAGNDAAAGAFDGIVMVIQSVMSVVGQLVNFANTTVKPIIESIFTFITQTVVPVILQTISAAAPYISGIISGIGTAIMTVAQIIGKAIQMAMPFIQSLVTILLNIGQVVIPAVLAAISVFAQGISDAIAGVKTIFEGIITFITGVFTGNWEQAWLGVRNIFTGIFDTLGALFKTPINAVIALINKAISGINGLGLDIPDWVPLIGGKKFSINIPEIPMLAKGGFTNGVSIAGEAGTEAVISFQRAVRQDNLRTWAMAGRMLGVKPVELKELPERENPGGGGGDFTFAPQIIIQGNADRSVIDEALAEAKAQFEAWYLQMQRKQVRTAY